MTYGLNQFNDPTGGIPQAPVQPQGHMPPMPPQRVPSMDPRMQFLNAPAMSDPALAIRNMQPAPVHPAIMSPNPGAQAPQAPSQPPIGGMIPNQSSLNIPKPAPASNMPGSMVDPQQQPTFEGKPTAIDQEKISKIAEAMPKAADTIPAVPSKEAPMVDPYTQKTMSDKPEDKIASLDMLEKAHTLDPKKVPPAMKADMEEINSKYKIGDIKGEPIMSCPFTNKPCGKKTFWRRLKEFFLHAVGMKSAEEKDAEILKLDHEDPIVQKYGKGTEGKTIPPRQNIQPAPQGGGIAHSNDQFTPLPPRPMYQRMAMEGDIA